MATRFGDLPLTGFKFLWLTLRILSMPWAARNRTRRVAKSTRPLRTDSADPSAEFHLAESYEGRERVDWSNSATAKISLVEFSTSSAHESRRAHRCCSTMPYRRLANFVVWRSGAIDIESRRRVRSCAVGRRAPTRQPSVGSPPGGPGRAPPTVHHGRSVDPALDWRLIGPFDCQSDPSVGPASNEAARALASVRSNGPIPKVTPRAHSAPRRGRGR
jgi:hypothetical protein